MFLNQIDKLFYLFVLTQVQFIFESIMEKFRNFYFSCSALYIATCTCKYPIKPNLINCIFSVHSHTYMYMHMFNFLEYYLCQISSIKTWNILLYDKYLLFLSLYHLQTYKQIDSRRKMEKIK